MATYSGKYYEWGNHLMLHSPHRGVTFYWSGTLSESTPVTMAKLVDLQIGSELKQYNGGFLNHRFVGYLNGKRYVIGGWGDVTGGPHSRIWCYDAASDTVKDFTDDITSCSTGNPNQCGNFGNIVADAQEGVFYSGSHCGGVVVRKFKMDNCSYQRLRLDAFQPIAQHCCGHVSIIPSKDGYIYFLANVDRGSFKLLRAKADDYLSATSSVDLGSLEQVHDFGQGGGCWHPWVLQLYDGSDFLTVIGFEEGGVYLFRNGSVEQLSTDKYVVFNQFGRAAIAQHTADNTVYAIVASNGNVEFNKVGSYTAPSSPGRYAFQGMVDGMVPVPVVQNGKLYVYDLLTGKALSATVLYKLNRVFVAEQKEVSYRARVNGTIGAPDGHVNATPEGVALPSIPQGMGIEFYVDETTVQA